MANAGGPAVSRAIRGRRCANGLRVICCILLEIASGERGIGERKRSARARNLHGGHAQHFGQLFRRDFQRSRSRPVAGCGLRIGSRARGVERDVAFHLLNDLMNVSVEHGDGAKSPE